MAIKNDGNAFDFIGLGEGDSTNTLPVQTLPNSKKTTKWKKANMDALERIGIHQLHSNMRIRSYRQMIEGTFTYVAVGLEELEEPHIKKELVKLKESSSVPSYIKHFDFIGIIVRVLKGLYSELEDRFFIDSRDEYATNEFIRQKTLMLEQYAQEKISAEINKLLFMKGINPYKADFETEEEAQAYQQYLAQQAQALTPPEIEKSLSKNFKVLAVEWAQNTINEDNGEFDIHSQDLENFVDFLLCGKYYKHFGVGYDNYYVERWLPEETFISTDYDAKYPQYGEFAGRISHMSASNLLNRYGHLMTTQQQEAIGNYWNQSKEYNGSYTGENSTPSEEDVFGETYITPFHNYFDHQANIAIEDATGEPMGIKTFENSEGEDVKLRTWLPRFGNQDEFRSDLYSSYLRDDIEVRRDTIRVVEAYWRSMKRLGVLIYTNDLGSLSVEVVTDDLLNDFLKEKGIKKLRSISVSDLQRALNNNKLEEYADTITYLYTPEVWKGIKVRGNASTLKEDLYLDVRPLDFQIKGSRSNLYDVLLPIAGIISQGVVQRLIPYQQLHNIAINQITEMLEKELGVFWTFDVTALSEEYKDQGFEEAIYNVRDVIKDTSLLGLDASRSNTGNNPTPPNLFQRHEVSFANFVQYRWTLAQQYKQEALSQIGITPQMLGAPNTYVTSEGVKQGMQASYALINPIFEEFTSAKAKEIELHIAVAQYAQTNGKDNTVLFRKSDGELRFLDILKEDGDKFPLRHLGVSAQHSSKDRKIIETLRNFVMNDNTIQKDFQDALDILTNPSIVELKNVADSARKRQEALTQQQREFESQQIDKQIAANKEQQEDLQKHETLIEAMKIDGKLKEAQIQSYGRLQDNDNIDSQLLDRIAKVTQDNVNNDFRSQEIAVKQDEVDRKAMNDKSNIAIEIQKLKQKSEELKLKREALNTQKFTSIINKN